MEMVDGMIDVLITGSGPTGLMLASELLHKSWTDCHNHHLSEREESVNVTQEARVITDKVNMPLVHAA